MNRTTHRKGNKKAHSIISDFLTAWHFSVPKLGSCGVLPKVWTNTFDSLPTPLRCTPRQGWEGDTPRQGWHLPHLRCRVHHICTYQRTWVPTAIDISICLTLRPAPKDCACLRPVLLVPAALSSWTSEGMWNTLIYNALGNPQEENDFRD